MSGKNVLQAKRALAEAPETLFAGCAKAVLPVLATLDEARVVSTVEPAFRWTAADSPKVVRAAGLRPAPLNDHPVPTS
ncbi:hypothetical protein [Methylobacterium gnaphalii]|uniref:hypothetical protein n=1 Tax=Methylobacterium gnaphalii TaxID=1010610 RepID=UPI0011BD7422|nr:hypothetical protein [Methylobacterium gnaphalii]